MTVVGSGSSTEQKSQSPLRTLPGAEEKFQEDQGCKRHVAVRDRDETKCWF